MPPIRTENKVSRIQKRQRPAVEEGFVQEGRNETAKRVRTSERLNARKETVKQQKGVEVSRPQVLSRGSTRKTRSTKRDQLHHAKTDGKEVSPQGFTRRANNISVAEVVNMVKKLNAEIEQLSSLMTDSPSYRRLPGSGSELGMELHEFRDYLGATLCNKLQRRLDKVKPDPLITQITIQTGLVNACNRIIMLSDWDCPFWAKDPTSSRMVSDMEQMEQVVANTWRKHTHTTTTVSLHENQEVYRKYLTEVLLNLIIAVGGSPQSEVAQYNAKLEGIVRQVIELQRIINKDASSTGLVTYTIPCDEEFDPSQMEDVKWDGDDVATAPLGRVACTVEMGLRRRKRVDSGSEIGVGVKPKVVLTATLEALCSTALEKRVKQLDAKVVELYRLLQMDEEKLSSMEVEANRRNEDHARKIERLEARIDQLLQKRTTELRDIEGVQRRQAAAGVRDISVEGEYTHKPSVVVRKADSISVAEVAELVRILNAQIEQLSILVEDLLSYKETPSSGEEARIALNELYDHVGQWLYNNLWSRSERPMEAESSGLITQITIQTGLVHVCCGIINGVLINGHSDAAGAEATDAPRALMHERKESVQKYLMELLLKLITAVCGSPETLPSQFSDKVEDITKKVIELRRVISQDVTSVELSTYTVPCHASFDPSQMEDTEGGEDMTVPVVCTSEMGLRCRKKIVHAKQSVSEGERQDVTMKAKVVLVTTLETE